MVKKSDKNDKENAASAYTMVFHERCLRPEKFTRLVWRAASLIEKETLKKRILNNEYRMSK